jgi:hypothetical protein
MKRTKLNLSLFEDAADILLDPVEGCHFACSAISKAAERKGYFSCFMDLKDIPERQFFRNLYGLSPNMLSKNYTFKQMVHSLNPLEDISDGELLEIRLLSLCFAHEAARQRNNRKG